MARQTKAQKAIENRISEAYRLGCSGIQINVMDIGRIFKIGEVAILRGANDDELQATIRAFVETIRN